MKDEFFYLGTLTRPFGLKGELCAFFDTDNPERYTQLDALFLDLDGEKIPYTVEHIAYRGNNQFVIKFDGIGPNECREFAQVELYLPLSQLPPLDGNRFYFHEVIGFTVIDERLGEIGTCQDFLEVSNNPSPKWTARTASSTSPPRKDSSKYTSNKTLPPHFYRIKTRVTETIKKSVYLHP